MPRSVITALALNLLAASVAAGATIRMVPVADNTMYSPAGNVSNGQGSDIFAGNTGNGDPRRALIRFAVVDSVPPGSLITAVTLEMTVTRTIAGPEPVALRRVLASWGEGNSVAVGPGGGGGGAAIGDATWTHRFYATSLWSRPGGDFDSTIVSTSTLVGGAGPWTWPGTPELVADVQHWLDHPADNHGWIVIGNETTSATAKRFGSRHTFPITARPWLTVTYTAVSAVPGEAPAPAIALGAAPNPFRHATDVRFELPHPALVGIQVFDLAGRLVRDLGREERPAGAHRLRWDGTSSSGRPAAHGVYLVQLTAGTHRQSVSVLRLH